MAVYQLTLFYPSLKANEGKLRGIQAEMKAISGDNWRVLSAGEQVCAIGFVTEIEPQQLEARLSAYKDEHFHFLLVEVRAIVAGYLSRHIWQWFASRIPLAS